MNSTATTHATRVRDGRLLTGTTLDDLLAAIGAETLEAAFLTLVRTAEEDVVPRV